MTVTAERVLTIRQPWADLIMAGIKDVENRTWPVPSTLPHYWRCSDGDVRLAPSVLRNDERPECCEPDGPFPFRLWVHAGQQIDPHSDIKGWRALGEAWDMGPINTQYHARQRAGHLLGSVEVRGCHRADTCARVPTIKEDPRPVVTLRQCSPWAERDVWHWTLRAPYADLPEPIPLRGRQGLWTLPGDVLEAAGRQLATAEGVTA